MELGHINQAVAFSVLKPADAPGMVAPDGNNEEDNVTMEECFLNSAH